MKPQNWDAYTQAIQSLIAGKIQVVFVKTAPGIGTLNGAIELLNEAGAKFTEFRCQQLVDDELVPRTKGGVSYLRTKALLYDNEGYIVILDEADVLFENGDRLEELMEMALAGVRMIIITQREGLVFCIPTSESVTLKAPSMYPEITITDEDRLEWLTKSVPNWDELPQERRNDILEDSRVNGMRAAILNECVRALKWGPPGKSYKVQS